MQCFRKENKAKYFNTRGKINYLNVFNTIHIIKKGGIFSGKS